MKLFSVLIIRYQAASKMLADAQSHEPCIQILWITLEKERAGSIMNRVIPLPEQRLNAQKTAGYIGQALSGILKECRPLCVLLDLDNCISPIKISTVEQKLKTQFSDVRLICATARHKAEN